MLLMVKYDVIFILDSYFYIVKLETTLENKKRMLDDHHENIIKKFKQYILDRNSNYRNRISDIKKAA